MPDVGQRSETVRRSNLGAIVRQLHLRGPLSRSELVAHTGLTRSAIRSLIGELAGAGIVSETRAQPGGTPGRPSPVVRLNAASRTVLALEISVDSIAAAQVGLGGEVLRYARADRVRGHSSVDDVASDVADLAHRVRDCSGGAAAEIGVGVSIVGVVRRVDGLVSMAPNLGWHDVPLGDVLARRLDIHVAIAVANDADLGALAEARRGAARTAAEQNVLFISGEVGVGGGLVVDGNPLTGEAGYAGEVGHMPLNPDGLPCRCGSRGCWETEIGEGALLRRAGHAADGGRAAVDEVVREAAAGSERALAAMDETGHWLGVGLALLVNVFNPRMIVLGGLLGRIHPFVAASVEREVGRMALSAPRRIVRIVPTGLGGQAPLLGAAELAFEPLLHDPALWLRPPLPAVARATA